MKYITILKIILGLLIFTTANAQDVTREEFETLLKRVQILEQKLMQTHQKEIENIAAEVTEHTSAPKQTGDEPNIIENVISVIQSREESVNYPWMDTAKWATIKKGTPLESVLEILGKPYTNESSLRKRIDNVFTYKGRRAATNEKVEGIIRFYKGEVVDIEPPSL